MEELRGTVWLYPHHPSTEGWHSLGPRVIFLTVIYPTEERESMWVNTQLPQLYTTCQRGSFLSCSIQSIESWVMWLWARRSGESRRYNYWRTVRGTDLNRVVNSTKNLPNSCWKCITSGSQLAHGNLKHSVCLTYKLPILWSAPCVCSRWWQQE